MSSENKKLFLNVQDFNSKLNLKFGFPRPLSRGIVKNTETRFVLFYERKRKGIIYGKVFTVEIILVLGKRV